MYRGNDTPKRTEGMMSLKQSDFVAMSCIAAGVVFPFALFGAYTTLQATRSSPVRIRRAHGSTSGSSAFWPWASCYCPSSLPESR